MERSLQPVKKVKAENAFGVRIRLEVPDNDRLLRPEMTVIVAIMAAT